MSYFSRKYIVKKCLNNNPATRDDDNALIVDVIREMEPNLLNLSSCELLFNLLEGKYGSMESLTRSRRKWQQKHESLRGERWYKRQGHQETVKTQLKVFYD